MMRHAAKVLLILVVGVCLCSVAAAQPPRTRYRPLYGPVLSPNLNFFRQNTGPLNQYLWYVQPSRNLLNTLQTQNYDLNLLQGEVRTIGQQEQIQATGVNSVYMNHTSYFQNQNAFFSTRNVAPGR